MSSGSELTRLEMKNVPHAHLDWKPEIEYTKSSNLLEADLYISKCRLFPFNLHVVLVLPLTNGYRKKDGRRHALAMPSPEIQSFVSNQVKYDVNPLKSASYYHQLQPYRMWRYPSLPVLVRSYSLFLSFCLPLLLTYLLVLFPREKKKEKV